MNDPQWFDEDRRIFAKRAWWRDVENVVLAVSILGVFVALGLAWARAESKPVAEPCIVQYTQHRVTVESRGVMVTDVAGRRICEVRRS